jgi:amidase
MQIFQESWQARAKAKVASIESKIHKGWRLEKAELDEAKKQRSLTGPFIERFLGNKEVEIIRNDSVQLVEKIKFQHYTAVEVAKAYCHTAAIAQQIVSKAFLAILLQLALLPSIGRCTQPNQDSF